MLFILRGRLRTRPRLQSFVFFALAGIVLTSSVAIAGVLLVFAYLVVPPLTAMFFSTSPVARLFIGWAVGAIVTACAILLSFQGDVPTGAAIVVALSAALGMVAGFRARRTAA